MDKDQITGLYSHVRRTFKDEYHHLFTTMMSKSIRTQSCELGNVQSCEVIDQEPLIHRERWRRKPANQKDFLVEKDAGAQAMSKRPQAQASGLFTKDVDLPHDKCVDE